MEEYIDDYVSCEEVTFGRPYPYMIYKIMERNNIKSVNNVIKFGDTQNDVLEGLNANCITVGVLSGADTKAKLIESRPTHILKSIMDIE